LYLSKWLVNSSLCLKLLLYVDLCCRFTGNWRQVAAADEEKWCADGASSTTGPSAQDICSRRETTNQGRHPHVRWKVGIPQKAWLNTSHHCLIRWFTNIASVYQKMGLLCDLWCYKISGTCIYLYIYVTWHSYHLLCVRTAICVPTWWIVKEMFWCHHELIIVFVITQWM